MIEPSGWRSGCSSLLKDRPAARRKKQIISAIHPTLILFDVPGDPYKFNDTPDGIQLFFIFLVVKIETDSLAHGMFSGVVQKKLKICDS